VTVWERLFHPTRAVGLEVDDCLVAIWRNIGDKLPYGKPYIKKDSH